MQQGVFMRRALAAAFLAVLGCGEFSADSAAAVEPADFRSQHFILHTDLPAERAKSLLSDLENELGFIADYWRRPSRGLIECYLAADLDNWPEGKLQPRGRKAIESGGGVTLTDRFRIGREIQVRATVYASAKGDSLKHEAVHAYCRQAFGKVGPMWYAEGMAEMGQYWLPNESGVNCELAVVQYLRKSEFRTIEEIVTMKSASAKNYAWAWSLCHLMAENPNYQDRFRRLGIQLLTGKRASFNKTFAKDLKRIDFEHRLFLSHLQRGVRVDLSAWDWKTPFGAPLKGTDQTLEIHAARGWQATGLSVKAGDRIAYRAKGGWRVEPKERTVSAEGDGGGRGRLVGVLMNEFRLGEPFSLGRGGTWTAPSPGKLYVRCNDDWHRLSDNQGSVLLTLPRPAAETTAAKSTTSSTDAKPSDQEKRASGKLRLAKLFLKSKPSIAKRRLQEIVQKYEGTKAAKEAGQLLRKLGD